MKCWTVRKNLNDYLDGAASPRISGELARHLRACTDCRSEYNSLQGVVKALGGYSSRSLPPTFDGALFKRIDGLPPGALSRRAGGLRAGRSAAWRWAATAGAVAALSAAAFELQPAPRHASSYVKACVAAHVSYHPSARESSVLDAAPEAALAEEIN